MANTNQSCRVLRVYFVKERAGIFFERNQEEYKGDLIEFNINGQAVQVDPGVVPKDKDPRVHMLYFGEIKKEDIDQAVKFIRSNPPSRNQDISNYVTKILAKMQGERLIRN